MSTKKAGCILFDRKTKRVALVFREHLNDWTFPKGHLENGESLAECAIRETAEETKRVAKIIDNIDPIINTYTTPKGEICECYFYLAEDCGKSDNSSKDTHPTKYFALGEVGKVLTYENLKPIWAKAKEIIKKIINE